MAKILIVEDEDALVTLLSYNLTSEGYEVYAIQDGEEASLALRDEVPDLLILDWMLPNLSGIELCRRLRFRKETKTLPIIMLTARGEERDKIQGLEMGADDYLTKPFSIAELLLRVKALLRRSRATLVEDQLKMGSLEFNRAKRRVYYDGHEIELAPTEMKLLEYLMIAEGRVVSREKLLHHVWSQEAEIDTRTVDVHIGRLRKIFRSQGSENVIRTVRGEGYAIVSE